jgi:hypothetical protein
MIEQELSLALYVAADRLARKIEKVAKSTDWTSLFTLYYSHGLKWPKDLDWDQEYSQLRAVLALVQAQIVADATPGSDAQGPPSAKDGDGAGG